MPTRKMSRPRSARPLRREDNVARALPKNTFDSEPTHACFRRLNADDRGVAAIEFGQVATFLTFSTLNVADISIYVYQRMELENAAHAAVLAPS